MKVGKKRRDSSMERTGQVKYNLNKQENKVMHPKTDPLGPEAEFFSVARWIF